MIPDAIAAVIAAVRDEHPAASSERLGRLVVAELRALGWHIAAPRIHTPQIHNAA
ncbi:hypothetical protein [Streptomyces sp. NPDC058045]|uniref:hypothetical protein n=1 Tax=Streptomyces sp. NPDC058045 TaxID=3346311 RepID=UPI0036E774A0